MINMYDFFFWFSVVSLIINIILMVFAYGQIVGGRKEKERRNAQVKIWMQSAQGLHEALLRIIQDKWADLYSSVQDVTNTVHAVHATAFAHYQSLYEERAITEEEYKQEQKELRESIRTNSKQENLPTDTPKIVPSKKIKK